MAELKGSFMDVLPAFLAGTAAALEIAAEQIMAEADILVPKDTETLLNSGFVDDAEDTGGRMRVTFGYGRGDALNPKDGRPASAYAVPVHEILGARHEPPTSAKFLEIAAVAYEPILERRMAYVIRGYLGEELASGVGTGE